MCRSVSHNENPRLKATNSRKISVKDEEVISGCSGRTASCQNARTKLLLFESGCAKRGPNLILSVWLKTKTISYGWTWK
jgi:hypothetical protein